MAMSLIHDAKFFTKEEILRRAEKYGFPNPLAVEIFLWDCELAAQLQDVCDDIVLKGGAAAQLYLPLDKQRGSLDIDLATPLKKSDIVEVIEKVSKSLKGYVNFERYVPKKPVPKLSLVTYLAKMPAKLDLRKREKLEIKIDIFYESPELPCLTLKNIHTYAVDVKRIRCLTPGALIGDKLLTLAKGSIGLEVESEYPKQIYDIDALLESCKISKSVVSDMLVSVKKLTKLEASFRNINITPIDALRDIVRTMDKYSQVDTSVGDVSIKRNIEGFQQFFVNMGQRKPYYEWSSKSLRIKFLAMLISENIENKLTESDVAKAIVDCQNIALRLNKISGSLVKELRKKLLGLLKTRIAYFKELKGKPLERVFWQIVTPENLQDIKSLIKSSF